MSFSLASENDILPFMRRHNLLTIKDIFKHDVAVIMCRGKYEKADRRGKVAHTRNFFIKMFNGLVTPKFNEARLWNVADAIFQGILE